MIAEICNKSFVLFRQSFDKKKLCVKINCLSLHLVGSRELMQYFNMIVITRYIQDKQDYISQHTELSVNVSIIVAR